MLYCSLKGEVENMDANAFKPLVSLFKFLLFVAPVLCVALGIFIGWVIWS